MSKDKDNSIEVAHDERQRTTFHHNKTVVDQIQSMYESGESVLKITQLFGVSSNYVHVSAKRKGWQRPSWYKWKFRPEKREDSAETIKVGKTTASRKAKTVISYNNDPAMLALFDKYVKQIEEQKTRIASLETMCNSFNRLAMIQEVYEQLGVDDKSSFYDEMFSSMRSEILALRQINETVAEENKMLKDEAKLLTERLKDSLEKEEIVCKKLSEAVAERDSLKDELEEIKNKLKGKE